MAIRFTHQSRQQPFDISKQITTLSRKLVSSLIIQGGVKLTPLGECFTRLTALSTPFCPGLGSLKVLLDNGALILGCRLLLEIIPSIAFQPSTSVADSSPLGRVTGVVRITYGQKARCSRSTSSGRTGAVLMTVGIAPSPDPDPSGDVSDGGVGRGGEVNAQSPTRRWHKAQ